MSSFSVARKPTAFRSVSNKSSETRWFTTHDAARALRMTPKGVRYLVADGKIACERTPSRRYLFLASTILALEAKRAKARLVLVPAGVHQKDRTTQQPHQLALFHVRLAIAPKAKEHFLNGKRKMSDPPMFCSASDKPCYVNP